MFRDPPKQYRPSPFWSWNDKLREDELRWQVREMKDKGFGGYFMHSRVGLITEYLSDEWMRMIEACLDEGTKADMESWLYDEDKWPSGFAGGIVPRMSRNYRSKGIEAAEISEEEVERTKKDDNVLGIFSIRNGPDGKLAETSRIHLGEGRILEGGRIMAFRTVVAKDNNWYNGESYVDLLDPEVTEAFLRSTHDAYAERSGDEFGEFMPGIFTDEPNYQGAGQIPWTSGFREYFSEKNGYDIAEKLPFLYYGGSESTKVRHDYWKAITRRFVEAFSVPLSKRCERLGLQLTGHYLAEDTLGSQIRVIGAAMPHYEFMHVPGIDHLCRNIQNPLTLKQASSAAHQFGRWRVMCEIFGCSGHTMTFEDQKWISDFHFALGITFLVPHLTLYSMPGDRKRDYPPTLSYHQPYWPHYRLINDYLSRCSLMMSQGEFVSDILVLHPIASAWSCYSACTPDEDWSRKNAEVDHYSRELCQLLETLLSIHRDFDFGDEFIIERHSAVDGKSLKVGKMRYKLVIVPPSLTWSSSTVRLLRSFVESGGKVMFVGQVPSMVDAEPSDQFNELLERPNARHVLNEREAIQPAIDLLLERDVSIVDAEGNEISDIYYHHRMKGARHIYFLSSKNRDVSLRARVTFKARGNASEWDPATGELTPARWDETNGRTVLETVFPPTGSRIFVLDKLRTERKKPQKETTKIIQVVPLHGGWKVKREHPNSVTLDYCEYSIDGSPVEGPTPVWKARHAATSAAGLEPYAGIQPWALNKKGIKGKPVDVKMKFRFEVKDVPTEIDLVAEKIEKFSLRVNGTMVRTETERWHWDKQFGRVSIGSCVKEGINEIELTCKYALGVEIEDIFLVGDFAVKRAGTQGFVIVRESGSMDDGNWVDQGFPFYCGTMRYLKKTKIPLRKGATYLLRLKRPMGTLFSVSINGRVVGFLWKRPWEIDMSKAIRKGDNVLEIAVVSSLRNAFGPLHHRLGDKLPWVGPGQFVDQVNWTDQYQFAPYGLLNGAEIVVVKQRVR